MAFTSYDVTYRCHCP